MSSSEKIETDYRGFLQKIEKNAAANLEKVRADLNELRNQAGKNVDTA
ncbi:MAG TPA: hypothetical protein VMD05_10320 [Candidatus Nanoarchaeia archaeon]|nr:hypothetical protein [Candidatus Nanoarchaeia archaeon]